VLFTAEFPHDSADAANIKKELSENLKAFELTNQDLKESCFLSDGGLNIVNALREYKRLYCAAHNLNVISSHIFSVKLSEIDLFGSAGAVLVSKVESLVSFLHATKLNKFLDGTIPLIEQKETRRYKSNVPILKSLAEPFTEVSLQVTAM